MTNGWKTRRDFDRRYRIRIQRSYVGLTTLIAEVMGVTIAAIAGARSVSLGLALVLVLIAAASTFVWLWGVSEES